MEITLLMVGFLAAVALVIWVGALWRAHRILAIGAITADLAAAALFIYVEPSIWAVLFATGTAYKLVNWLRLIFGRMRADYSRRVSGRAAAVITALQVLLCGLAYADTAPDMTFGTLAYAVPLVQLALALVLLSSTSRHLRTTKTLQATTAYTDQQLPTVSVLIPARNETDDLHNCLTALTASNYPKLEIIVLDDCSQNKHTPEIIRGFAQAGVRFIAGKPPTDSWLAKNYAYQQLTEAASGDYLMFCGVDLRVTPGAIRELITTMLEKDKTMLSILPQNVRPRAWRTQLVQPLRYAWELSLPRRLFNRPPILSTCWIVKQDFLETVGSFKAASRSIVPESHFARAAARQDGYSFLRSNLLVSDKPASEQVATTIRMRYPQLHRRLELVWLLSLLELICLVLPLPLTVVLFMSGFMLAGLIALVAYACTIIVMLQVSGVMYGRPLPWMFIITPLMGVYDIVLLNYSMYRYEFKDVQWKDRNICLPIMRLDTPPVPKTSN